MHPKNRRMFGAPEVFEKYGVPPEALVDLMALIGDVADNIPGVKGIGPKNAAALMNKFRCDMFPMCPTYALSARSFSHRWVWQLHIRHFPPTSHTI